MRPDPETDAIDEAPVITVPTTGPQEPQGGVPKPGTPSLHTRKWAETADLWCVGVHGGAGETSLDALAPGWRAAEHAWPVVDTDPQTVVLVARSHVSGLLAAQRAATEWASGASPPVNLLGLIIMADAPGRLPRPLRDLCQVVAGGSPRTWTVPWIQRWRLGEQPAIATAPRSVRRLVSDLTHLTTTSSE